jgi:apolipoprotein N-acyltransferase
MKSFENSGFVWAIQKQWARVISFGCHRRAVEGGAQDMRQISPFGWLALGGVFATLCLGRGTIPLAAWLAPIFLLRFARITPPFAGLLSIWLVLLVAAAVSNRGVIPLSGFAYFGVVLIIAIALTLSYVADRMLASRFAGLASTLIFPLAWVAVEFINTRTGPFGSWGSVAYTQYGNLPLMQLASVTGIFGIAFLIAWFASVVNWAWHHDFAWYAIRGGVLLYAGVFSLVMLAGATRLALGASEVKSVRAAVISGPAGMFNPGDETRILHGEVRDEERAGFRKAFGRLQDWFLENTRREAQAGARIVVWPEVNLLVFKDDETTFLKRAQQLAGEEQIYLLMGMGAVCPGGSRPLENKAVLVNPFGEIDFSYLKSRLVPGGEARVSSPGNARLPISDTQYGRMAAAICFDMDFPQLIQQVGRAEADLLLAPANDWDVIKHLHLRMAIFRAIENGVSMVRATKSGLSGAVDAFGRTLAVTDHFWPGAQIMIAQVPLTRVCTIYTRVGDLFAWLCIASLLIIIAAALRVVRTQSSPSRSCARATKPSH